MNTIMKELIELKIDGAAVRIASMRIAGEGAPVLILHGFGGTKEDYADLMLFPRFAGRTIIAYDAPGFGESDCGDVSKLSIPFLCKAAEAVIGFYDLGQFHLAGHSMGGLTALILAERNRTALLSFTNIEGNLAPEDCFLSRQIFERPSGGPDENLDSLIEWLRQTPAYSNSLYAVGLRHKVHPGVTAPVFQSLVDHSAKGNLIEKFAQLPCSKMFIYGSANRSLSYLDLLKDSGIQLAEIPYCGHFPMYANPPALWAVMSDFIIRSEAEHFVG